MSGIEVIGSLLLSDPPLLVLVPAERIKAELLPEGVELPALLVREVSSVERQMLRRGQITRTNERIAVTVRASNYKQRKAIMGAITRACAGAMGAIAGVSAVAVRTAGRGPGVIGPNSSFEQTQDFMVGFDAPSVEGGAPASGMATPASTPIDALDWAP